MARRDLIVQLPGAGAALDRPAVADAIAIVGDAVSGYIRVLELREKGNVYVQVRAARREDARLLLETLRAERDVLDPDSRRLLIAGLVAVLVGELP
jgi:hypothetical protein